MRLKHLATLVAATLCAGNAYAAGTSFSVSGAYDQVYDPQKDIIYITTQTQVLRWSVATGAFLTPMSFPNSFLLGIDVSQDGKTIAVADENFGAVRTLHLIDTATLVDHPQNFSALISGEGGTWSVVYADKGDIFVSETYAGSGWAPIRHYDATSKTWGIIGSPMELRMMSPLSVSGDGKVIAFADAADSGGPWGFYNMSTGTLNHSGVTGTNNSNIVVNATGSQFVINDTRVYDNKLQGVANLNGDGVVYDPVRPILYQLKDGTNLINVLNGSTFATSHSITASGAMFTGGGPLGSGRIRLSRDGSFLSTLMDTGVFYYRNYAPLATSNASATGAAGVPIAIPVSATLGVAGPITYTVPGKPAHGTATVVGNTVNYTADDRFTGTETFTYQAHYAQAVVNGTITVQVTPFQNHVPVALHDSAVLHDSKPVLIDVLANDSDPDGNALTVISATQPATGIVSIKDNQIQYTPPATGDATGSFTYRIADHFGGVASASVGIVDHRNHPPVAVHDAAVLHDSGPMLIDVLANDSDPDGQALTIVSVKQPALGTVAIQGGKVFFTPSATRGDTSFTYKISDHAGGVATGSVRIVDRRKP